MKSFGMGKFVSFLILALTLALHGNARCQQPASSDFALKVQVEASLESRLKSVLADVVGTGNVAVIVSAELETEVRRSAESSANTMILPGVPIKKEFSSGAGSSVVPEDLKSKIRRLSVTILIDKRISESLKNTVRDLATTVIGFDQRRGDKLDIREMSLGRNTFDWMSVFYPPQVYWLIFTVIGMVFLVIAISFILNNPFKKLAHEFLHNVNWEFFQNLPSQRPPADGEPAMEMPKSPSAGGNTQTVIEVHERLDGDSSMPFSFIQARHLPDLAYMLKDEPIRNMAIIATYLSTEMATRLLEHFPPERQVDAALCLSSLEEVEPAEVNLLEERIRNKLRYKVGGEHKAATLLGMSTEGVRRRALEVITRNNPETASRLKEMARSFEDAIMETPAETIQAASRQLDRTLFAQVLTSSPVEVQNKVLGSLPEVAAERLRQEMELSPPLPEKRIRKEKYRIAMLLHSMETASEEETE